MYKGLETPKDGVLIHGLFVDAGRWDLKSMLLVDANIGKNINYLSNVFFRILYCTKYIHEMHFR